MFTVMYADREAHYAPLQRSGSSSLPGDFKYWASMIPGTHLPRCGQKLTPTKICPRARSSGGWLQNEMTHPGQLRSHWR